MTAFPWLVILALGRGRIERGLCALHGRHFSWMFLGSGYFTKIEVQIVVGGELGQEALTVRRIAMSSLLITQEKHEQHEF